jgi:hypothetical protein
MTPEQAHIVAGAFAGLAWLAIIAKLVQTGFAAFREAFPRTHDSRGRRIA